MRLKSLEIKGFKSFADKTVLNFDEGITGVIGPNGCGKSNIVDSIRWVIGEHKISNLRSENLESLVFNGSKTRSASGLAEVSLTFENTKNLLPTEFSTVTITRKFYKSGESEYRLNDVQCRLKDIHNLFLDTGVSTDSYAIIELGMVDDIIKDKENSRRKMLEQAAGISIYKTRKKEAKLKLDATEQDLARIEDLLFEINNQLKALENQAKKAEKYYEIKKEYKEVSIELAKAALEGFNITYRDLNEQQQAEVDKRIELETAIAKEEAALEQEKLGFAEKEKVLQQMQHEFNEMLDAVRSKESEKNLTAQRLKHLQEKEKDLNDFLQRSSGQLQGLSESIQFTSAQIVDEEGKVQQLEVHLSELKNVVEEKRKVFDENRGAIDSARRENQSLQRSQFEAEKKVAVADTSIQNLQRSVSQIQEEKAQRQTQIEQLENDKQQKEETLNNKKTDLQQLQEQHQNTKEQILQTQSLLESLRLELAEENRKLDSKKNEHALLKSLIDSMEGYPESVKFLHNNSEWNYSAPLLSDIIYVKEEYRAAVENILEPYLNYYVVNNLQEGLQAVHLLDNKKKGKANFFLLDKFSGFESTHQPDGTIPALNVIEIDEKYAQLANHLLGNVFIAENEDALQNSNGAVVLEKTGKYVKGKYSLTGGSVGLFEGKKIGRAKNLEKLAEEIHAQEQVVNELKEKIQAHHNEVISFNQQLKDQAIQQTQKEINELTNQVFALQNKAENLRHTEETSTRRLNELTQQLTVNQDAILSTRTELEQLNLQLQQLAEQLQVVEQSYANAELEYNAATATFNESNLQFTRQQSKIVSLKQEFEFKSKQLKELEVEIEKSNTQLGETSGSIAETHTALTELETLVASLLQNKEVEEKKLNEADREYYNLRTQLQEKESELRHKQKSKEGVEHLLSEIKDKLTDLKLQLAGMKERLSVEFKVDLDAIIDEPRTGDTPLEELQEKSERMRKRLENIGEVNPTAIEAFTEMKKRYEFILEQKNDLVTAKDSLLQTIQEVEATANQQFLDTFNMVRDNFQKVFKALFTEDDTADMVLVDPENLAETAIDIVAKPKGKRPSSIGQLSGGEKTLTATALLFAIYLIKPAPFCILDEVDAPLDDANVGKFTNMIKQFSENSQFIIVTHNKMTMSAVDVIYGVTMQEPGVSKLVPVDFRSLN
ncbi:chromosome segregation protein SMC [Ferruginibacter albus]|uniref:chromosome segregation protein SMC n=1 Tax=Ferruginibacter albus TaxID=2875540 RepID=UPI001CC4BDA4|nr:chromosome segregation protein SMC [Ferruginibacter albus]UAY51006.1 chromosome segregation protein SMC [Ferruginibacter albus]